MTLSKIWAAILTLSLIVLQTAAAEEKAGSRHPRYFGYYYADGRWGDFTSAVWPYTNLYIAIPGGYNTALDWRPLFRSSMERAFNNGKSVLLIVGDDRARRVPVTIEAVLTIARPYWDRVELIEVAHEEDLTPHALEQRISALKLALDERGLAHKPFGLTYTRNQALTGEGMHASGVSWVAVEAYVDPPAVSDAKACPERPPTQSPGPAFVPTADCTGWVPIDHPLARLPDSVTDLNKFLEQAKRRIPPDKQIVFIMMAYDRNGQWTNPDTLAALQLPVFLQAYDDPRVAAILMFSYGQPGGTRFYPRLQEIHRQIGEQILGERR